MKLKKLSVLFTATLLTAALLVGCGGDTEKQPDSTADSASTSVASQDTTDDVSESTGDDASEQSVGALFDAVSAANAIANPRDLTDMNIELDFALTKEDIVEYKGIASNDNGDAGMVLVIEAADGKADAIVATLETYAENQVLFWNNYEEFADAKASVESSVIKQEGNYVIQVFAANGADYTDISTAITDALG